MWPDHKQCVLPRATPLCPPANLLIIISCWPPPRTVRSEQTQKSSRVAFTVWTSGCTLEMKGGGGLPFRTNRGNFSISSLPLLFMCVCVRRASIDTHLVLRLQFFPPSCQEALLAHSPVTLNLAGDQESVDIFDHNFTFVLVQGHLNGTS